MAERDQGRALYIISVAAELAGRHAQTLRIYERKGLIEPQRTQGGSRRYSDVDIELLRRIQELTNEGVSLAGVTFAGNPWNEHGRKIFAYDPVSRKMIMARPFGLTEGYQPEWLKAETSACPRCATWSYDPQTRKWDRLVSAPPGVTALVTTPRGVIGVQPL